MAFMSHLICHVSYMPPSLFENQRSLKLKRGAIHAGYFSLNVPSGLTLYWFVNNLLSTAQQVKHLTSCSCDTMGWNCLMLIFRHKALSLTPLQIKVEMWVFFFVYCSGTCTIWPFCPHSIFHCWGLTAEAEFIGVSQTEYPCPSHGIWWWRQQRSDVWI